MALRFLQTLMLLAFVALPRECLAFSEGDKRQLQSSASDFIVAVKSGNYTDLFGFTPSGVVQYLAEKEGISEEALIAETAELMREFMDSVVLKAATMDATNAVYNVTPDGSREYVLMRTEFVFAAVGVGHIRVVEHTLAFQEEGRWRFARTSEEQIIEVLVKVYPEFEDVNLPEATTERLD